jgi:hypothetical protein
MRVSLTRQAARVASVILLPVVVVSKLIRRVKGDVKSHDYVSTIDCDPTTYTGPRPLVVAIWAEYASIWEITESIVKQMQSEFAGVCEFAFVDGGKIDVQRKYDISAVPAVLVYHRGKEVGKFINLIKPEQLRDHLLAQLRQ